MKYSILASLKFDEFNPVALGISLNYGGNNDRVFDFPVYKIAPSVKSMLVELNNTTDVEVYAVLVNVGNYELFKNYGIAVYDNEPTIFHSIAVDVNTQQVPAGGDVIVPVSAFGEPNILPTTDMTVIVYSTSAPTQGSFIASLQIPEQQVGVVGVNFKNGQGQPVVTIYLVNFIAVGLPYYDEFSVTFNGITQTTKSREIPFWVLSGTYGYAVNSPVGYSVKPNSGTITLSGTNYVQNIYINFEPVPNLLYVNFLETGESGLKWSASINDGELISSTTGSVISFPAPTPQVTYSITPPTGYVASPSSGIVDLVDKSVTVVIDMSISSLYYGAGSEFSILNAQTGEITQVELSP